MFLKRHSRILSFCLTFLITASMAATGEVKKLDLQLDQNKLKNGELQVFQYEFDKSGEGVKKRVIGVMLFNAPPDKLWSVLKKWERTPEFVSSVKYYKTLQVLTPVKKGGIGESIIEGNMKAAFMNFIFTLHVKFFENERRHEWRLLNNTEIGNYRGKGVPVQDNSSTLGSVDGFGYVESYEDGKKSVYYYAPSVEISVPVPSYIERSLIKSSLNDYMNGLKKMIEQ